MRLAAALGAMILSGCATIATRSADLVESSLYEDGDGPGSLPRVYSGTIADGWAVTHDRSGQAGFFCLLDLPLSFAADLLILPWTLYEQVRYGSYRPRCIPEKVEARRRQIRRDREAAVALCRAQRARGIDDCKSIIAADGTVLIELEPPGPLCPVKSR